MRSTVAFESFEQRLMWSATASAALPHVIGPSSGLIAAAATPQFTQLVTDPDSEAPDTANPNNTAVQRDSTLRLKFNPADSGVGIDASNLNRAAIQITDLTNLDADGNPVVYNSSYADSDPRNIKNFLQKVKTSGGGDVLVIQPNNPWTANTHFRLEVNGTYTTNSLKVRDVNGVRFDYFAADFTTSNVLPGPSVQDVSFDATKQTIAGTRPYIATAIGPDHRLYASTSDGYIYRYDIAANGALSNEFQINTVRANNGGNRIITGITFDPGSTPDNLGLWVSHGQYRFGNNPNGSDDVQKYAQNFTGKISVISGENLQDYQDKIVGIPRSVKDHMNNQIVFDPKGKNLYFCVAAMNAMGQADPVWGNVAENVHSAVIMRAKVGGDLGLNRWVSTKGPIDLTVNGDGTTRYNILKGSNPLRYFATGVRNDFDMVWATNGHLYAGINGSSAGGNTPATPSDLSTVPVNYRPDKTARPTYAGPTAPALTRVSRIEEDTLLDVKEGAYYGHPNPTRGEYVLDGGNPTADVDPYEFPAGTGSVGYPVGQQPDANYTLPAYDFGTNYSPDGMLQYSAVGNKAANLAGYLLVARYSSGSDIVALKPNADGSIDQNSLQVRIPGFTNLDSPLDMVEDTTTGNIYVTNLSNETNAGGITLLVPEAGNTVAQPKAEGDRKKISYYVKPGRSPATRNVTFTNTGNADLIFDPTQSGVGGKGRKNFALIDFPTEAFTVPAGGTISFAVRAQLFKGQTTTAAATLLLKFNDPNLADGYATLPLRAFNANTTAPAALMATTGSVYAGRSTSTAFAAAGSLMDELKLTDA